MRSRRCVRENQFIQLSASNVNVLEARVVLIVSISSDIGSQLALHYLRNGATVCGTYRNEVPASLLRHERLHTVCCNVTSAQSIAALTELLESLELKWNIFISCVGQLAPIGRFSECNFEEWNLSVETNSLAQLRALHAVYPFRSRQGFNHAVFFAGGGTNGPFHNYSAYCLGKIALIKMCELLDDEEEKLNPFVVGTGWVNTKIHGQTLAAGDSAGTNLATTQAFVADPAKGTSYQDIIAMIDWGIQQGKSVVGGRNFSVVHDGWRAGGDQLAAELRNDSQMYKLRRLGNR